VAQVGAAGPFVADLKTLRDGFTLAHNRFEELLHKEAAGLASEAFHPLFEALNWAIAVGDRLDQEWPDTTATHHWHDDFPDSPNGPSPETMRAIRFVRNRVHHSWADALEVVARTPVKDHWDQSTYEWRWRRAAEIPGAGQGTRDGEAEYERLLARRPVVAALRKLEGLFALAIQEVPLGTHSPVYKRAHAGSRWTP
jgi:hypothetical protein